MAGESGGVGLLNEGAAVGTYHQLEELVPGWGCPEGLVEWSLLGPR